MTNDLQILPFTISHSSCSSVRETTAATDNTLPSSILSVPIHQRKLCHLQSMAVWDVHAKVHLINADLPWPHYTLPGRLKFTHDPSQSINAWELFHWWNGLPTRCTVTKKEKNTNILVYVIYFSLFILSVDRDWHLLNQLNQTVDHIHTSRARDGQVWKTFP